MNIYDVLRHVVRSTNWNNEVEQVEAYGVIDSLEASNAFGTVASNTTTVLHDHVPVTGGDKWVLSACYRNTVCRICGIELTPYTLVKRGW